ncbi:DUF2062 domain-containing protein [Croceicoccus sp. YJ47]|uniref:DUF2062 domain-containing protein n=1 Tax=Croceicoccus sp. YJ47 TaxID=2798724 RepID=UPI001F2116A9|nr:DUF2062 domain-containing protein [Croceicoccus sp. YJ47]
MKKRLIDWTRGRMPTREGMADNRFLAPIAHRFLSPELWRFTRRSVPRGVALGLFAAFIVPLGQIFLAAFLALPTRANVPLAAAVTFVTNPFTVPFWVVFANRVGGALLRADYYAGAPLSDHIDNGWWSRMGQFFETAGVTAFGFVVLAVGSAIIGYFVSGWLWRWQVGRRRRHALSIRQEARILARERQAGSGD